jgi:hypothetical protein
MRHGEDNAPALDAGSGAEQGKQLGHLQREHVAYPFLGCEVHPVKASTFNTCAKIDERPWASVVE